jgi:hypothetical protein
MCHISRQVTLKSRSKRIRPTRADGAHFATFASDRHGNHLRATEGTGERWRGNCGLVVTVECRSNFKRHNDVAIVEVKSFPRVLPIAQAFQLGLRDLDGFVHCPVCVLPKVIMSFTHEEVASIGLAPFLMEVREG